MPSTSQARTPAGRVDELACVPTLLRCGVGLWPAARDVDTQEAACEGSAARSVEGSPLTWPVEQAAQREEYLLLARFFLSKLDPRRQAAIRMWARGVPQPEIAVVLGLTAGGVWMMIDAAVKELRENFHSIRVDAGPD